MTYVVIMTNSFPIVIEYRNKELISQFLEYISMPDTLSRQLSIGYNVVLHPGSICGTIVLRGPQKNLPFPCILCNYETQTSAFMRTEEDLYEREF